MTFSESKQASYQRSLPWYRPRPHIVLPRDRVSFPKDPSKKDTSSEKVDPKAIGQAILRELANKGEIIEEIAKKADLTATPTGPMPTQHPGFKRPKSYAPIQSSKKAMDLTHLEAPVPAPQPLPDTHFALGNRYPITDPHQVKVASDYFDEHVNLFSPAERREYALNLCKRASELGMPELLGETARRYGGPMTRNLNQIKYAFASRQPFLVGEEGERHQEILDKIATKLPYLSPHDQLQALAAFDKVAGLERLYGTWLKDPVELLTEKWAEPAPFSEEVNGNIVLENELVFLSKAGIKELKEFFGDSVVQQMRADPVGTFKKLPKEQKLLMSRIAKAIHGHGHSTPVP